LLVAKSPTFQCGVRFGVNFGFSIVVIRSS
jgi:hypothetical protein